jgi:sugar phosphate permease
MMIDVTPILDAIFGFGSTIAYAVVLAIIVGVIRGQGWPLEKK